MPHEGNLLQAAVVFLLAAVLTVPLAKRLQLGAVLGYLFAGVIIGPSVLGLIGKAVTAPFALIAHAFGGAADDFKQVDFALGSALLDESTRSRLQLVAQAMARRPDLRLTLEAQSELERERSAYQQAQLQQRLLEEKRRQLARDGQPADAVATPSAAESEDLLRAVYRRADMPKPRNLIGLAKELPAAEMEKLLLATIAVDADRMRELALARASVVRDELVRLASSTSASTCWPRLRQAPISSSCGVPR